MAKEILQIVLRRLRLKRVGEETIRVIEEPFGEDSGEHQLEIRRREFRGLPLDEQGEEGRGRQGPGHSGG